MASTLIIVLVGWAVAALSGRLVRRQAQIQTPPGRTGTGLAGG
ncbi:hypothetical protein ACPPVO_06805 [Dactylosporangium sp. McL0621]